jgi:very-short-patch-repair endonuclease
MAGQIRVEVQSAPTLNFAMEQSGVPIVSGLRIENAGGESIEGADLTITIRPNLAEEASFRIPKIRAGETVDLGVLDVRIEPGRLRAVREAERAELAWAVHRAGNILVSGRQPIDVLAYNEWAGLRAPPALLATFVTPNAPAIAPALARVRDRLRSNTGDAGLTGYQQHVPERVRAMLRAVYETIASLGMTYVGLPASFEEAGQKIRLADALATEKMGNCLDATVFMASCLEQMGLSPLLVIQKGHAFPGVWLVNDRYHDGVVYDATRLRNSAALGHVAFCDSSSALHDPPIDFAVAERTALDGLKHDATFVCVIDVPVARRDRYRPLPLRAAESERAPAGSRSAPGAPGSPIADGIDRGVYAAPPNGAPQAEAPAPSGTEARLKQWRDRLLDLSLRNKLLNFRKDAKGALQLTVPNLPRFADLLAGPDPEFAIHPRPDADARDHRDAHLAKLRTDNEVLQAELAADLERRLLHCPLDEARMVKHVVHLEREARTALEEGGANVLYAGVGFLRWYETDSSVSERIAPLLLVPVSIDYVRSTRRARIRRVQEDSLPNQTLIEKVQRDFGLDLSSLANLEPDEGGVDVPAMLRGVREATQRMKRWEVLEEVHLGLFQFTKFLMWRDLEENQEVLLQNEIVRHLASGATEPFPDRGEHLPPERLDDEVPPVQLPLVLDADSTQTSAIHAALNGTSFVLQGPPGTGKSQTITNLIAVAIARGQTVLFVSEKMAALEVVHRRLQNVGLGDFCLELHSHKIQKKQVLQSLGRTLARAERRRRPDWASASHDLGGLRAKLNAYVRALHAPHPLGRSFHQASARLLALRGMPEVRVECANVLALTQDALRDAIRVAEAFSTAAAGVEPVANHPFRECGVAGWSAQADQEARDTSAAVLVALDALTASSTTLLQSLGIPTSLPLAELEPLADISANIADGSVPAGWRDEATWRALRERVTAWSDLRDDQAARRTDLALRWHDSILALDDVGTLGALFARWATAFFLLAWIFLFRARKRLRTVAATRLPANEQIAADLAKAKLVRENEELLRTDERAITRLFEPCTSSTVPADIAAVLARGDKLRNLDRRLEALAGSSPRGTSLQQAKERLFAFASPEASDDERRSIVRAARTLGEHLTVYTRAVEHVQRQLALTPRGWPADGPEHLPEVKRLIRSWADQMGAFRSWCLYRRTCGAMQSAGLGSLVASHAEGRIPAASATSCVERSLLHAWTIAARDAQPVLRDFDGPNHHRLVESFRRADAEHLELARDHIVATLEGKLPRPGDAAATSEPGILKRELAKKTRHKALRKLLSEIPNLLVRLKPCLLMSPLSVAQYLPAGGKRFDMVVFDEASQIGPHDAIGAIARGNQVVIVGDSKQLPPTSFFQRTVDDDGPVDEEACEDLESILDQALAASLPEQMLGWHYRSRHEALIEFSNARYYDNRLHVFPAARGRVPELGVRFHHVPNGVYDAGKTRQNAIEAQALVDELVRSLKTHAPKVRSFGVVTFSAAQKELVEDLLVRACERFPEIEAHFSETHPNQEKIFVKNLENVQGDERDEILFSVGYGRDAAGKLVMNFGPLNRDGGERRLNVAITRARMQFRLFASITHDQIDTNRTHATGAAHLKAFLRFAAERSLSSNDVGDEPPGDFDSDFERDVYDVLRATGHRVMTQVGCGGYRIDLAVCHPKHRGVFALGIECDGAAYHSGATARDRDRLRQAVLEGLGWRLHRIWSTDWTYNRTREVQRLEVAIEEAFQREPAAASPARPPPATPEITVESHTAGTDEVRKPVSDSPSTPSPVVPYQRAALEQIASDSDQLHAPEQLQTLRLLALRVLNTEAPIHIDELSRRVAGAFGGARVTDRLRRRMMEALSGLHTFQVVEEFVWSRDVIRENWRVVRAPGAADDEREIEVIPLEEISAAARWVLQQNLSMGTSDLYRETARLFGIQRLGQKIEDRVRSGVRHLTLGGDCEESDGRVEWTGP